MILTFLCVPVNIICKYFYILKLLKACRFENMTKRKDDKIESITLNNKKKNK